MNDLTRAEIERVGGRVAHQQCLACGHAWVDYVGQRPVCVLCQSNNLSRAVSLSYIREVIGKAQKLVADGQLTTADLDTRKAILQRDYTKAAPVFTQRADESFPRLSDKYLSGDVSDRCLDGLIFCFHLFTELGLHDAAVRCAMLIGSGYFRRVQDKDIRSINDLADLAASRQWFQHLGQHEWVATVDLFIGLKTGHTVVEHIRDKYLLLQISRVHLHRAHQYYADRNLPTIQQRVEKEADWINDQLSHAIGAAAQIEAAEINASSRVQAAEITAQAVSQLADSLEGVAESISSGFARLAIGVENGLDTLGRRIDTAGGRIGAAIAWGSQYVGDSHREGARELGRELAQSIDRAGDKASTAMTGLGTKIALGVVGGGALNAAILDGTLKQLASTIVPQVRQGLEQITLLDPATPHAAGSDIERFRDTLVTQGLDEANRRVRPYGIEVGLAGNTGG